MLKKIALIFILMFSLFIFENTFSELTQQQKMLNDQWGNEEDSSYKDPATDDISSKGFKISVDDFSPGMKVNGGTTSENVNFALGTIIQTLMIALGSLALIIMTIGAGYIILHNGEDSLLSKGKAIFMSGIYALLIALSSYYLVSMVRFILYNSTN